MGKNRFVGACASRGGYGARPEGEIRLHGPFPHGYGPVSGRGTGAKAACMAAARRFGLVLDAGVTGRIGDCGTVTFDHPTHSFGGDCRSITVSGCAPMPELWAEARERIEDEGPRLMPCTDPECDYHGGEDDGDL